MSEINRGGHFPDLPKLAFIDRNGSPRGSDIPSQFFTSWSKIWGSSTRKASQRLVMYLLPLKPISTNFNLSMLLG
jgi:hypothetical protein